MLCSALLRHCCLLSPSPPGTLQAATELAVGFMQDAVEESKPFYVQLWLHMSHSTIDPRPEQ